MHDLAPFKIAMTGASGHLGYILHQLLKSEGLDQRILLREKVDHLKYEDSVIGDLEDPESLRALCKGCHTLIHCAAIVWPRIGKNRRVQHVNYELTKSLYQIAADSGVKHFIFISSIHSMKVPSKDSTFDETAELAKSQILMQAGVSVLAQANQQPSLALSLIG